MISFDNLVSDVVDPFIFRIANPEKDIQFAVGLSLEESIQLSDVGLKFGSESIGCELIHYGVRIVWTMRLKSYGYPSRLRTGCSDRHDEFCKMASDRSVPKDVETEQRALLTQTAGSDWRAARVTVRVLSHVTRWRGNV